jgi:hypothetical protein
MNITPKHRTALPNSSACISHGELKDARRQMRTLDDAGLPIPRHLQEWLKQNFDALATELLIYRRIIAEVEASGPNVVPFPAPRNHAEEIANARAAEEGGAA